jgi:hypothetical protein
MGLLFTIVAGPRQWSHSQVEVPWDLWPHLLSQIRNFPNLKGPVPIFISPRNRVAQLHPQALGSLSAASNNSQAYSGGIQTHLHTWFSQLDSWSSFYILGAEHTENTASNSSSLAVWHVNRGCCLAMNWVFVDAGMCLPATA